MSDMSKNITPPVIEIGIIGWLRKNLFSTWYNTILTLIGLYFIGNLVFLLNYFSPVNNNFTYLILLLILLGNFINKEKLKIDSEVLKKLLSHLQNRTDVQNIDLMNLSGFC